MTKLVRCDCCKKIIKELYDEDGYNKFLTIVTECEGRGYLNARFDLCKECIDKCLNALGKTVNDFYDFERD